MNFLTTFWSLSAGVLLFACSAANATEVVTYYYTDAQGTPLATADAQGNIILSADYRPYGLQFLGQASGSPGYTGHVNDQDSGFVYMQARYYDPEIGRSISVDHVRPIAGDLNYTNDYAYVGDNPINRVDPGGNYFCSSKIKGACDDFKKALASVKTAAGAYSSKSAEGKALNAVLSFYGPENAKNSAGRTVNVIVGATSRNGDPGEISSGRTSTTITLDLVGDKTLFSSPVNGGDTSAEIGASVAHEGVHGIDDANRISAGKRETEDTVRSTEHNAYRTQSYVNHGLGVDSAYGLWRSNWAPADVDALREKQVDFYSEQSVNSWKSQ